MITKKMTLGADVVVDTGITGPVSVQLTPDVAGDFAVSLLRGYVPFDESDAKFAEVCKDFGGNGTTCGFLPHWLMWKLGVRSGNVNRNEPQDGLHYLSGMNIAKIWNQGKTPFVPAAIGVLPEPGDICFISNGPPITEHVFAVLSLHQMSDGTVGLEVAEAGQTNEQGKQCARIHLPVLKNGMIGTRKLVGWLSLKNLSYVAQALLVDPAGNPLA